MAEKKAFLPFDYLLIMALSFCGLWMLNMLMLRIIDGGFIAITLTTLALAALLWLPWLRMFLQSDRPDKRTLKPLFPHYFWISLIVTILFTVTILVFIGAQFGVEDKLNLMQRPAQLITALHFLWFWSWWHRLFYRYET